MAIKKKVKGKRKGNVVSVDFTGVESGGRACPDGTFKAEITAAAEEESSTGNPMVVAKFKILNGKGKGALIYDNLSLQPQALFRLKALCEAVGIEAEGAADIDLDDLVGQEILVDVENETYEGKKRPRAVGYAAIDSEAEEEESEDDADSEEEEESEESEEEEDDAEEEEEKPKKSSKVKKKGKAVKEEEEEEEAEEEEEEEEEDAEEEDEDEEEERPTKKKVGRVNGKTNTGLAKGAKVKFKDGKTVIKGTVVSVKNKTCRVEDKNGDEYDVPSEQVELI